MTDMPEGTIVDSRYKIVGRLGTGGMADVFLAEDQQLGRKLALKLLHHRFAEDSGFVERFRREAQAAAGLQHPNVVSVYDRGAYDGTYYIAMEYVPGRTLKQLIREEAPLDPVRAIDLVCEILKAVRFAHRRGVIHRDLKPHNVIVDASDHAKVTDFGIARAGASDMTETGSILGTAQYLSPEQAQGLAVSPSSDLYSVGVILYELLTGRVPFDAQAAVTVAIKHVSEAPVAPRTLNPSVPPELEQITLWALNKRPADRPDDADEFLGALKHARAAITTGVVTEHTAALSAITAAVPVAAAVHSAPPLYSSDIAESPPPAILAAGGDGRALGEGPEPPVERRRRDLWLWLGLLALLIAAAAAATVFLLTAPNQTTVPAVVGKQVKAATTTLTRAGFKVAVRRTRSPRAAGLVLRQNPPSGSQANTGSTVRLTVSAGPGTVLVPRVSGKPLAQAEGLIRRAGLRIGKVEGVHNSAVTPGDVSSTSPFAGEPVARGTPVTVFVSSGPPQVRVPNVTGEPEAVARAALETQGFSVTVTTKITTSVPTGTVVSQSPAPGTQVSEGSNVTLVVAKQPPSKPKTTPTPSTHTNTHTTPRTHTTPTPTKVSVPNVVTKSQAQANSVLSAAGFHVKVTTQTVTAKNQDGIVLSQSPTGGTKADKGATVTIVVGHYSQPPGAPRVQ